jgi:hypothetical protein
MHNRFLLLYQEHTLDPGELEAAANLAETLR